MAVEYLTFEEYQALGGKVDTATFTTLYRKACHLLDYWTQDRLKSATIIIDDVKELLVEMIDKINSWGTGERVTSFSNGKVSMSFDTTKTQEQELYELALVYLPVSLISGVVDYED